MMKQSIYCITLLLLFSGTFCYKIITKDDNIIEYDLESKNQTYEVETIDRSDMTDGNVKEIKIPGNNLLIGECKSTDQRIYTDNTAIENSGPSTLNGTLEIYIDSPIIIRCIRVEDQITDGSGGVPTLNSGGIGYNWVFIDVIGKYGKGFHFHIHIYGEPDMEKLSKQHLN